VRITPPHSNIGSLQPEQLDSFDFENLDQPLPFDQGMQDLFGTMSPTNFQTLLSGPNLPSGPNSGYDLSVPNLMMSMSNGMSVSNSRD